MVLRGWAIGVLEGAYDVHTICSVIVPTWNCRGAAKEVAHSYCKKLITYSCRADFITLLEVQIQEFRARRIHSSVARGPWFKVCALAREKSGVIILWWKEHVHHLMVYSRFGLLVFCMTSFDAIEWRLLWDSVVEGGLALIYNDCYGWFHVVSLEDDNSGRAFKEDGVVWDLCDCNMKFIGWNFTWLNE